MSRISPVCKPGEFRIAAIGLDHGHINGMCGGLVDAGATLVAVYDRDAGKMNAFAGKFPGVKLAASEEEILGDDSIHLIASAIVPSQRCELGLRALDRGKHYFSDKPGFISLEQLERAKAKTAETNVKWGILYGERLCSEACVFADTLIRDGAIGRVVQVIGTGPHRARIDTRPEWFFDPELAGGILCDIGSHQIEQFLHFAGAKDAKIVHSKVANYKFKNYPLFRDFGDAALVADNGATFYFRVDWFTPDALQAFGDGRVTILGTEGYIEMRKNVDIAHSGDGNHLYLVNHDTERHYALTGQTGLPYFGRFILDCLNGTEEAMTQEHAFKAAELSIKAQEMAVRIE